MLKEVIDDMISHQTDNINKETEIIKKDQMEILELKSTITEMKNSLEVLTHTFGLQEESIKDRLIEIMQFEEQRRKQHQRNVRHPLSTPTFT